MKFPLTEPTNSRYFWINGETNQVHVLMPVVSGTQIGLDNTCKSVYALQEFFGLSQEEHQKAVLDELIAYKKALEFDMILIGKNSELKNQKQERLEQINKYIEAIEDILNSDILQILDLAYPAYPEALNNLMEHEDSNLYSIVLRPCEQDGFLRFVHTVFSVTREGRSLFHEALVDAYEGVTNLGAKAKLYSSVLASTEGQQIDFIEIQRTLKEQIKSQLDVDVDFDHTNTYEPVTKELIDEYLGCDEEHPASTEDYIEGLLNTCAPVLFDSLDESPFYTRNNAEELSIITQFFLGVTNVYCRANELSLANFGEVLDNSEDLSQTIAALVVSVTNGTSIEDALLDFVNNNSQDFGLTRPLGPVDRRQVKERFKQDYSAIKKSPHFDEFALLDDRKGLFVSHQGSICGNLAEFIRAAIPELAPDYFVSICADFKGRNSDITSTNPSVHSIIELSIEELLERITDEDQLEAVLNKLPEDQKRLILASPQVKRLQLLKLLLHVARGQQDEAQNLLEANAEAQLLLQKEEFTDYSGRTFHCTAYEYAYWAKDTHMCRMLEQHMDDETKAKMLILCEAMERDGLTYTQHGEDKKSVHFDFTSLITALKDYADAFDNWQEVGAWDEALTALINIGKAQRDVPAHVAHEYCRPGRSFYPLPEFYEPSLPRILTYYNHEIGGLDSWFPLNISTPSSGLGVDFALYKSSGIGVAGTGARRPWLLGGGRAAHDMEAVTHLDEVRTADLAQSRENLMHREPSSGLGRT